MLLSNIGGKMSEDYQKKKKEYQSRQYKMGYGQAMADVLTFLGQALRECHEAHDSDWRFGMSTSDEQQNIIKYRIESLKWVRSFVRAKRKKK